MRCIVKGVFWKRFVLEWVSEWMWFGHPITIQLESIQQTTKRRKIVLLFIPQHYFCPWKVLLIVCSFFLLLLLMIFFFFIPPQLNFVVQQIGNTCFRSRSDMNSSAQKEKNTTKWIEMLTPISMALNWVNRLCSLS